ncbi:MAG: hypothetical protein K1X79_08215 [Oligoflexia bacterium]|nr:hypothetical protein [Oligoflexia bacterium]
MKTVNKLMEISSRLEHLESAAQWIAKETVHSDNTVSQTSTLIQTLADDIRERMLELVRELETMHSSGGHIH